MTRRTLVLVAVMTMALASQPASAGGPNQGSGITAIPIVTGLAYPAAFTIAPDGRIFYGERLTGNIRVYNPVDHSNKLFGVIPGVQSQGERGLLGLALQAAAFPIVYAYATRLVNGTPTNQILKVAAVPTVIFTSNVPSQQIHNGGRILFGPDGDLYAVIGEAGNPSNSQDLSRHGGKILRMTATGAVPPGNPFQGNLVWSYGHRNSFGFTFDPLTGRLWETENGPECNDELNLINAGANYGWGPHESCSSPPPPPANTNQDGPSPTMPLAWFTPTIAPTGTAFCVGCGLPSSEGTLFFGAYNTNTITRVVLDASRTGIVSMQAVYTHPNPILSMERGPDKAIYFSDPSGIYKLVPG